jgi:hypothetical protein
MEVKMASQTKKMLLGYSLIGLAGPVCVFLWPYLGAWTLLTLVPLVLASSWLTSVRKDSRVMESDAFTDADVDAADEAIRDDDYKGPTLEDELRLNPAYSMIPGNVHYRITATDHNPNSL